MVANGFGYSRLSLSDLRGATVELTLTIPDELASRLRPVQDRLPRIIERGLRDLDAQAPAFVGLGDVLETLARLPSPEEVLALRPSTALQARAEELLTKNRTNGLSDDERREWDQYQYAEHLVRIAKAKAAQKLAGK
jgi:hypothetical protein